MNPGLSPFIHLRVHTAYSLAEGAIKIKQIPTLCHNHHMPAIGITDTANMFGALECATICADEGVQMIVGTQMNIIGPGLSTPYPLPLYATSEEGYQNLLKLSTRSYFHPAHGHQPSVSMDDLQHYRNGLILTTGGTGGPLNTLLHQGNVDNAIIFFKHLVDVFPDHLYVEISRHGMPDEITTEDQLINMAYDYHVPLVGTNHVYFSTKDMYDPHDALLCITEGSYVVDDNRRHLTPEFYFKSGEDMASLFADIPESITSTYTIAQRCHFMPSGRAPILPRFESPTGLSEDEELKHQAQEGLKSRLQTCDLSTIYGDRAGAMTTLYHERLDYELGVIHHMGFSGYFLIVADFIKWAKTKRIPVGPGRGSGAGSLVAWSLTITDIDPIRFGLIFERFLNPERVSMPDFDVDFCQHRRDEVIHYVAEKYGLNRIAHIITFGKLQARAVLKDVGRVMQMPYAQVDRICKLIPNNPTAPMTLKDALVKEPALGQEMAVDPTVRTLVEYGIKLEGLYRHTSIHAAGIVIGDRPLDELIPLYKDPKSELPATQFNMKYVELAGLVKFDFLGLKTLTILQYTVDLLAAKGIHIDLSTIPLDDRATFDMLCRVETVGIFQLESSGMRDVLRRMKPDTFEDIIALVALYRPGPMDDIPRYIACKHGEEDVSYAHPFMEPILRDTFGVMVYQEQVMHCAQKLAGYSLGGADLLRRAMGKKIPKEMQAQRTIFVEGAGKNGIPTDLAHVIFDQMAKFAGYGFNKSHAAPYALLSYQTAYLKANYPLEFFASIMTLDIHNTDKLAYFTAEIKRLGIPLYPPDVNASQVDFAVEDNGIRYALAGLKNIGVGAMQSLVAERNLRGPYSDIQDMVMRLDGKVINKKTLEALILSGACDSLHSNRHQLYASVDNLLKQAAFIAEEKKSSQKNLFGSLPPRFFEWQAVEPWSPMETLQREYDAIGCYISSHPLDHIVIPGTLTARDIQDMSETRDVSLIGIITSVDRRMSKNGNPFCFIKLSDPTGTFECVAFTDTIHTYKDILIEGKSVLINCMAKYESENIRLMIRNVSILDDVLNRMGKTIHITAHTTQDIHSIQQILKTCHPGSTEIILHVPVDHTIEAKLTLGHYDIPMDLRSMLQQFNHTLTPTSNI